MNKKKIDNNKGFTLVELIVVLVILAILAAILVPALLGYIDRARGQQVVLNGRSAYTAAQAEMTAKYAKAKTTDTLALTSTEVTRIKNTADLPSTCTSFKFACKSNAIKKDNKLNHDAFTVNYVEYTEDGKTVFLCNGDWINEEDMVDSDKVTEGLFTVIGD